MKSPKDAKKYEETQITRIPIHRRRPKKILKKMEKCNKCKRNEPAAQKCNIKDYIEYWRRRGMCE
jgi:hypothetical protein